MLVTKTKHNFVENVYIKTILNTIRHFIHWNNCLVIPYLLHTLMKTSSHITTQLFIRYYFDRLVFGLSSEPGLEQDRV